MSKICFIQITAAFNGDMKLSILRNSVFYFCNTKQNKKTSKLTVRNCTEIMSTSSITLEQIMQNIRNRDTRWQNKQISEQWHFQQRVGMGKSLQQMWQDTTARTKSGRNTKYKGQTGDTYWEHIFTQLTGKAALKFIHSDKVRILCASTVTRKKH